MAHAYTVAKVPGSASARGHTVVQITQTGADADDDVPIPGLPKFGRIERVTAKLSAGTGTTIDSLIGRAAEFTVTDLDFIWANGTGAAFINEAPGIPYYSETGELFFRLVPNNATADHAATAEILILDGWQD